MGDGKIGDTEKPRLGNATYKHPLRPQMVVMDPSDNLPRPAAVTSMTDTVAPALSLETLICMGDESAFVIRDLWGTELVRVAETMVRRGRHTGGQFVKTDDLTHDDLTLLVKKGIIAGAKIGSSRPDRPEYLPVEPLRPQCQHYRRVMIDFEGQDQHRQVERVCTAQRTEAGEFTNLSDTRVYACEHRSPRDFVSEERLRRFDEKIIEAGKKTDEEWVPPTHGESK